MIDISIIIVSYKVKSLLIDCLQSIFQNNNGLSIEIIVVDNNSNDGSVEAVKEKFKTVTLIENKINLGFPAANNQALKIAEGKFILLLNPDTEIKVDALLKMIQFLNENPAISLLGPKLLNSDGSFQSSYWRFPTFWNVTVELFYLNKIFNNKYYPEKKSDTPFEVDSLSGAALFFRKELLQKIGLLDETLFWIEDIDFCYRAKQNGYKIIYFPDAEIIHHIGQSAKKDYRISLSNQVFNKIKFFGKHYSRLSKISITIVSFIHCVLKLIAFSILAPVNIIARRKAAAYWYMLPKIFNPPTSIA